MSVENAHWLATVDELDRWLADLPRELSVAMDTEFERVSTFFPKPGLVQLGIPGDARLVEPEVAAASDRFRQWLTDPPRPNCSMP